MSNLNKAGDLPRIEIGQGRQKTATPVPPASKPKETPAPQKPSGAVNGIVFTPKDSGGRQVSLYLRKAAVDKLDAICAEYGLSRSEVARTLLNKALGVEH